MYWEILKRPQMAKWGQDSKKFGGGIFRGKFIAMPVCLHYHPLLNMTPPGSYYGANFEECPDHCCQPFKCMQWYNKEVPSIRQIDFRSKYWNLTPLYRLSPLLSSQPHPPGDFKLYNVNSQQRTFQNSFFSLLTITLATLVFETPRACRCILACLIAWPSICSNIVS